MFGKWNLAHVVLKYFLNLNMLEMLEPDRQYSAMLWWQKLFDELFQSTRAFDGCYFKSEQLHLQLISHIYIFIQQMLVSKATYHTSKNLDFFKKYR